MRSILGLKLLVDFLHLAFDRNLTPVEVYADFPVGISLCGQVEDFCLLGAETYTGRILIRSDVGFFVSVPTWQYVAQ